MDGKGWGWAVSPRCLVTKGAQCTCTKLFSLLKRSPLPSGVLAPPHASRPPPPELQMLSQVCVPCTWNMWSPQTAFQGSCMWKRCRNGGAHCPQEKAPLLSDSWEAWHVDTLPAHIGQAQYKHSSQILASEAQGPSTLSKILKWK